MILVAGGSGRLGTRVVQLLAERGRRVRVLTRDPARAHHLVDPLVEIVQGDIHDPVAVERAVAGASIVISAFHGFIGTGANSPETVDWQGNQTLIRASVAAGIERFILVSVHGASSDHPMSLFRMKHRAEQALQASGLVSTIIRPTAYMETWVDLIGAPLLRTGKTRLFGRGANPINFVSVADVALHVELATNETGPSRVISVGGPENLTFQQLAETFANVAGVAGTIRRTPLPMMRAMAVVLRPINPTLARQVQAGVVMDTQDMTFDPSEIIRCCPDIVPTPLTTVIVRDYLNGTHPMPQP